MPTYFNNPTATTAVPGQNSPAVGVLQTQLNAQNAGKPGWTPLTVDSLYGPKTVAGAAFGQPTQTHTVVNSNAASNLGNNLNSSINNYENNIANTDYTKVPQVDLNKQITDLNTAADTESENYAKNIANIQAGNNLTAYEKSSLASTQAILDQNKALQEKNNDLYQRGLGEANIRSGRAQNSPEAAAGLMHAAVNEGIQKVQNLDIKANAQMAKVKQGMIDGDIKVAKDAHDEYVKLIKDKQDAVFKLNDAALKQNEYLLKVDQAGKTSTIKEYEYAKSQGYKGSILDYKASAHAATSASKAPAYITPDAVKAYGLPDSMVGVSSKQILSDLDSETAPAWFNALGSGDSWDTFRNNPELLPFKNAAYNLKNNSSSSGGGGDYSGL